MKLNEVAMLKRLLLLFVIVLLVVPCLQELKLSAQLYSPFDKESTAIRAYVKELNSLYLFEGVKQAKSLHLIHSRLSYTWYMTEELSFRTDVRGQLQYGSWISSLNDFKIPGFFDGYAETQFLKEDAVSLSTVFLDRQSSYGFGAIDRLSLSYQKENWDVVLGRQRINWGFNFLWNPNDLFNAYQFTDVDYEERPGSDALLIKRNVGSSGSYSFVVQAGRDWREFTYAMNGRWNVNKYDVQFLLASYRGGYAIGTGWAGSIADWGIRGEFTALLALDDPLISTKGLLAGIGTEYAWDKGLLFQLELLYNSFGSNESDVSLVGALEPSAFTIDRLSPYRWNAVIALAKQVHPLVMINASLLVAPFNEQFFFSPAINYTVGQNTELLFFAQITTTQEVPLPGFGDFNGLLNLRYKYSF